MMKHTIIVVIISLSSVFIAIGQENDTAISPLTFKFLPGLNFRKMTALPSQDIRSIAFPHLGISSSFNTRKGGFHARSSFFIEWQRYLSVSPRYKVTNLTTSCHLELGLTFFKNCIWYSGFFYNASNSATLRYHVPGININESAQKLPSEYGWSNGIEINMSKNLSFETKILMSYQYILDPLFMFGFNIIFFDKKIKS